MPDTDYETQGHSPVLADADGTLHSGGAQINPLKLSAQVDASALPTADPHVVGRVWRNAGVLTVSAG